MEKKNHNRLEELCNYGPQREHLMKMGLNNSCEIKANQSCTGFFMRLHNHIQLTSSPEEDSQCARQLKYHNWHGK